MRRHLTLHRRGQRSTSTDGAFWVSVNRSNVRRSAAPRKPEYAERGVGCNALG